MLLESHAGFDLASRGQLVKISITLESHNKLLCLGQLLHTGLFLRCPATGMRNGDRSAGRL